MNEWMKLSDKFIDGPSKNSFFGRGHELKWLEDTGLNKNMFYPIVYHIIFDANS